MDRVDPRAVDLIVLFASLPVDTTLTTRRYLLTNFP